MSQSFTSHQGQVYLAGSALSDHRIDDLLALFEKEVAQAELAAHAARCAFNALWDARCAAKDFRSERAA